MRTRAPSHRGVGSWPEGAGLGPHPQGFLEDRSHKAGPVDDGDGLG
jgi:hypothetical protein